MNLAHSSSEPRKPHLTTRLCVRFVSVLPLQFPIKNSYSMSDAMNDSNANQNEEAMPSLFQIAAFFEDLFPAAGSRKPAPAVSQTQAPLANLISNPKKLEAVLKSTNTSNGAGKPRSKEIKPRRTRIPKGKPGKSGANSGDNRNAPALPGLPKVQFSLEAPEAKSVKLAADFTHWAEHAIEMMPSLEGIWLTVVPLAPGSYAYRFIVDGEWRDDPRCTRRLPNPFGTENAVVLVTSAEA